MASIVVFVRYNSRWDQNNLYVNHKIMGVLVPRGTTYIGLLNILFKAMKLKTENHTIGTKYVVELELFQ